MKLEGTIELVEDGRVSRAYADGVVFEKLCGCHKLLEGFIPSGTNGSLPTYMRDGDEVEVEYWCSSCEQSIYENFVVTTSIKFTPVSEKANEIIDDLRTSLPCSDNQEQVKTSESQLKRCVECSVCDYHVFDTCRDCMQKFLDKLQRVIKQCQK